MQTSLELSDALYSRLKKRARQEGVSTRALIERGITLVLSTSTTARPKFDFRGDLAQELGGLTREAAKLDWSAIREMANRGFPTNADRN